MQAVILVGGFGTRLRPLTYSVPKPLLPIANVRQLEHMIAALSSTGVNRVALALGFKPEPFLRAFPDGTCAGVELHYAIEPEPLDTAGAIAFVARDAGIHETFVVMNGDILTDLDVSALVRFHHARGAEGTLHLTPVDDPSQYGVVETDREGWVRRFVEKPAPGETDSRTINAGTYVLEPQVLDRIPDLERMSVERVVFPAMAAEGRLAAMATDDYWIDTGRPDTYLRANLDLIDGSRTRILASVGANATVAASASVTHSVIGEGASVEAGAVIVDSVVLPGARVGASARLERCLVMGQVGPGATLADCVVGADGEVDARANLVGARIPDPATVDPATMG
ncbi:MAG: sugar phosphate nucleotidyltransferase [Acidimicrobiales bacterium]